MQRLTYSILAMVLGLSIALAALWISPVQAAGNTFYVDDDNCPGPGNGTMGDPFCKIQNGITAALSGDTVQVAAGIYLENIIMKSGVVIQGAGQGVSIIDGNDSDSVLTAIGVTSTAKLDGFTITNGASIVGGGMYNENSSPTVTNCTFSENSAFQGGGMYNVDYSSPTVTNCTFSGNSADSGGGMINTDNSSPTVTNCTFLENTAVSGGGGMDNYNNSSPTVTNCTFSGNTADYGGGMENDSYSSPTVTNCTFSGNTADYGGGIFNQENSSPTVTNSILWGDNPEEIYNNNAFLSVTYSDIQGAYAGTGNINAAPMFVAQANGDFHLRQGSPCIDAGDNSATSLPATDIDGDERKIDDPKVPDTGSGTPPIVDMGVDEYVPKVKSMPWILLLLGN